MAFFNTSLFSFSFRSIKADFSSFLFFKPTKVDNLSSSIPNVVCYIFICGFFNFIGFLCAKIFNINIFEVIYDIISALIIKSFFIVFIVIFAVGMSVVYSFFIEESRFNLSYIYLFILSSVHLPIFLFLAFLINTQGILSTGNIIMLLQGLIADHLSRSAVSYKEDEPLRNKKSFILTSLGLNLLFYGIILKFLYSK